MPYPRKYVFKDPLVKQNKYLRAISGANKAKPIRNLVVKVGVQLLGIYADCLQAQFRVRQEESDVAKAIREAVRRVKR